MMKLKNKTIPGILEERVRLSNQRIAMIVEDQTYTWRDCDRITDAIAIYLFKIGVSYGDAVGLWGTNAIEWVLSFLAIEKLGAVAVLLNPAYHADEMRDLMERTRVRWLLIGDLKRDLNYKQILKEIRIDLPELRRWICMGDDILPLIDSIHSHTAEGPKTLTTIVSPGDPAMVIFTSGTTRRPKGVILGHGQVIEAMQSVADHMDWHEDDRLLLPLPLFHGSGINAGLITTILSGMSCVLLPGFHSAAAMEAIERYHCTVFNAVPSMLIMMARHPQRANYDLSSLQSGILSGSVISPEHYEKILQCLPFRYLIPAYGMTETSTLNTMMPLNDPLEKMAASVGKALPGMKIRIAAVGSDVALSAGEEGEIQIAGDCIMQGYDGEPALTAASRTRDGWFHTGDGGTMDAEGYVYFKARLSAMIVRGGENISPPEIESVIDSFDDDIQMSKVIGIPDPIMQEEPVAIIQMTENAAEPLNQAGLMSYLEKKLAYYKLPKYIFEVKNFPMTSSGKINLNQMRVQVMRMIQEKEKGGNVNE
jgi:acyl-CoA synthetase (AMP-forming)/AMP-acid ligase II